MQAVSHQVFFHLPLKVTNERIRQLLLFDQF